MEDISHNSGLFSLTNVQFQTPPCHASMLARTRFMERTSVPAPTAKKKFDKFDRPVDDTDVRPADLMREGFSRATWTPTGYSSLCGCMLATVSTSHAVQLWEPSGSPASSTWGMVHDLSDALLVHYGFSNADVVKSKKNRDKLETTCEWDLYFQRSRLRFYDSNAGNANIEPVHPQTRGVGARSSRWGPKPGASLCGDGYLASGASDGSVKVWGIRVHEGETTVVLRTVISQPDYQAASVIKFYHAPQDNSAPKLAIAKGRQVTIWLSPPPETPEEVGLESVAYEISSTFAVSGIVWGIKGDEIRVYTLDGKCLTLVLSDLSVERHLELNEDCTNQIHQEILQLYKPLPSPEAEQDDTPPLPAAATAASASGDDDDDVPGASDAEGKLLRIYGADASSNSMVDALVFSFASANDMEYRTEKSEVSSLILRLWFTQDDDLENLIVDRLCHLLVRNDLFTAWTPAYLLWDIIQYCESESPQWTGTEHSFFHRLVGTLRDFFVMYNAKPILDGEPGPGEPNAMIFKDLSAYLYCNVKFNSLRLMNFLIMNLKGLRALVLMTSYRPPSYGEQEAMRENVIKAQMSATLASNTRSLFMHSIETILKSAEARLTARPDFEVTESDALILTLMTDWTLKNHALTRTLLPHVKGILERLAQPTRTLSEQMQLSARSSVEIVDALLLSSAAAIVAPSDAFRLPEREKCMACHSLIDVVSPWKGQCPSGHAWGMVDELFVRERGEERAMRWARDKRCSATLLLCTSVAVRCCLGCNRKARGEVPGGGRLSERLLAEFDQCIYCGGRFYAPMDDA
ncbi:hypothetical protein BDK51DRAFT_39462 [Blyttiomyces helicus]|uniref:Uncharacterized protein n=1 Tax=Blyttiomyces helicus TaxID=388810 RepID=A0A4P9W936_9FUNG|nr:hypothetical protein BDK51DRAFT_39462 [Blyttiomyces helicus]|eukprot:RKO86706.1 hypothetical protein BDK51DRAFT_39462 [Blyttiomyces helicus]